MKRDKVMIGTPMKGPPVKEFMLGMLEVLRLTDADYVFSTCESSYIQHGRQFLANNARKQGCDELIFADADMPFRAAHVARLRSHENVDIVGAVYPKRKSGEPEWTCHRSEGEARGDLVPVNDIGMGLCRIKMSVFERLDAFLPQRRFQHDGEEEQTEYFPVGLTVKDGWKHPAEARLDEIAAILTRFPPEGGSYSLQEEIVRLMSQKQPPCHCTGEDVSFVRLCQAAGITAFADLGCVIRHVGSASYPLKEIPL